jgi:hypothetical protein
MAAGRELKREFLRGLSQLPFDELLKFSDTLPAQGIIHGLFSCLCSSSEKVRWYSISVFGRVMARLADEELEKARVVMRRFMWMLNDESAGIGWGVPEAIAETLACHARLAEEYAHILVSFMREEGFYLELEALQRGLMWGLGRAAQQRRALLLENKAAVYLRPYLDSQDPTVRGLTAWAFGNLRAPGAEKKLESLCKDDSQIRLYEQGQFSAVTVGELAAKALWQLGQADPEN